MSQRAIVRALLFLLPVSSFAAPWQGVYYQNDTPGNAVEFRENRCAIRSHEGASVREGEWTTNEDARVVHSCCQRFLFRLGKEDTLLDATNSVWGRTPPVWPLQKLRRGPLHIRVIEEGTSAPVTNFLFQYSLSSPQGNEYPPWVFMQRVCDTSGTVTIEAPVTCELHLEVDALEYLCHGSGYGRHTYDVLSTNHTRLITVRLQRGLTVEGVVLDADTGAPIPEAKVAPLIEYHPGESRNAHREVTTDGSGRFCVYAVSEWRGIGVEHARYGESEHREPKKWEKVGGDPHRRRTVIRLKQASKLAGRSVSADGAPLAGVSVVSYNGRRTKTLADGTFEIYGAERRLDFSLPRYITQEIELTRGTTNLVVVLDRKFSLVGRVITPDGTPVTNFVVATRDGPYDGEFWTRKETFRNPEGRFEFEVSCPVTNLVAVHADGFALTHAPAILSRPPQPITVVMQPGTTVSGRLILPPDHRAPVSVSLIPQCEGPFWRSTGKGIPGWVEGRGGAGGKTASEMGTRTTTADTNGQYRIEHVAPGSYTLDVKSEGLVPQLRTVRIPLHGRVLPVLSLRNTSAGAGTLRGRIYSRDRTEMRPWVFASGELFHFDEKGSTVRLDKGIPFKADEKGDYCMTNVPAGPVIISVRYNITFDVIGSQTATGVVHAGKTTILDCAPEPEPPRATGKHGGQVTATVIAGDGTEMDFARGTGFLSPSPATNAWEQPRWHLVLHPFGAESSDDQRRSSVPFAYANRTFTFMDLCPGKYRAVLTESEYRWVPPDEALWTNSEPIAVSADTNVAFTIRLPANSVRGKVRGSERGWSEHLYLVPETNGTTARSVSSGRNGDFVIRFVPEGTCTVFAYEDDSGWCRRTGIVVKGACDTGSWDLQPGTRLSARLMGDWVPFRSIGTVKLKHASTGIVMEKYPDSGENGGTAVFDNLWPGNWRLSLVTGETTLFSTNLVLGGLDPVTVDMTWSEISVPTSAE